jgi:hypothetical protein
MKKLSLAFLLAVLLLSLTACGGFVSIMPGSQGLETVEDAQENSQSDQEGFQETALYTFLGWSDLGDNFYDNTPVALSVQYNDGCVSPVFDRSSIVTACEALRQMTVTGRAQEGQSYDVEQTYTLTMSDGKEYTLTFRDGLLYTYTGVYTVSGGTDLWNISFPAYSEGFDLFDLYFDDSVRAFADNFYEDTPVSVGRRANSGATLTSEDPEIVRQVFLVLANATITVVEDRPDQNIDLTQTQDYIFTMADGSYYTFTFAQQCLAVRANASYGTVYYWLGNIDTLWNINVVPEDTNGQFEGGALSGLRSDFEEAAAIANGEDSSLSIEGVYVDYTIDGEKGYLTLSGDTAKDFVRQVVNVSVTDETVDEPEGDTITVSVTLSDWSGPILYFTGDSVQQVVGVNYACDSSDMASLRSTILSLAADGNNTAQIGESTTE